MKGLIVFDLDGTLAPSKSAIDAEMGTLIAALLGVVKVAIISGGALPQFEKQVLAHLPQHANLDNLSLLPTCGTRFFRYADGWQQIYAEDLSEAQRQQIIAALNGAVASSGFKAEKTWGEPIEDRGSQITYSALGQQAPLDEKKKWDPDFSKRKKIKTILGESLSGFSVRLGGSTSIDVTLPGIDKAYGIKKLRDILSLPIQEMIYVGDALFPGGNDAPVRGTGADCIQVRDPDEAKRVIEAIVACLKGDLKMADNILIKLGDADLRISDPTADIRDRKVLDRHGHEIGHVSGLFVDKNERKVRILQVAAGGFLGLGERHFLVPVEAISGITQHEVRLNQTREHVVNSPPYDPHLTEGASHGFWESYYGYYGRSPDWSGYVSSGLVL